MKLQLLRYWLAMNASALQAAAHATKTFFGVAGVHALTDAVPALQFKQCAAVFLLAFGAEILDWLTDHPLPVLPPLASAQPPFTPVTQLSGK